MIYAGVDSNGTDYNVNAWIVPGGGAGLRREPDGSLRSVQLRNGKVTGIENPMSYHRPMTRATFRPPFEVSGEIMLHSRADDPFIFGENRKPTWQWVPNWHPAFVDEDNNIVTGCNPGVGWSASGEIDHKYDIARDFVYVKRPDTLEFGRWYRWRVSVPAIGHHAVFIDDVRVYEVIEKVPPARWWNRPIHVALRLDFYDVSMRNLTGDNVTLPIQTVTMPTDLIGKSNGRLPTEMLTHVGPRGDLHHLAARAFVALRAAASEVGLPLTYTYGGTYRSYVEQEALFRSRYSPTGTGGGCKNWNGTQWCKKSSNLATAATPGTSNHGWGLAIDTAFDTDPSDGLGPDDAAAITGHPQWPWLLANAARFGFSWELQSEPWHIRYVTGDNIPQAVLDHEDVVPPPPPTKEVDMIAIDYKPGTPEWTALVSTGTQLAWVFDGHADAVYRAAGVGRVEVSGAQLTGLIKSSQTTTDAPSTLSASDKALWEQRRA